MLIAVDPHNMANQPDNVGDAAAQLREFESRADASDPQASELLQQMRAYVSKMEEARAHEDPRLSFTTPEFKAAQRVFADKLADNFGREADWVMVKEHPWSVPRLAKKPGNQ